jgi:hypothetical protein
MMRNRQVYLTPAEVIVVLKAAKERSARLDDDFARLSSWMPRQRDLQPATRRRRPEAPGDHDSQVDYQALHG